MNITISANSAFNTDTTFTGTLSVSGATSINVHIGKSNGSLYRGNTIGWDGASVVTFNLADGSNFVVDQGNGTWTYYRISSEASASSTDTYTITLVTSDSSSSIQDSATVNPLMAAVINSFTSNTAYDKATQITGTVDLTVNKSTNLNIAISVGGNTGSHQAYSNYLMWTYADGSKMEVNFSAKTWTYTRPSGDVGDLNSDTYFIGLQTYLSNDMIDSAYATVSTVVEHPPSIDNFGLSTVGDEVATITGQLVVSYSSGSNIGIVLKKNGTTVSGGNAIAFANSMTFRYGDGSVLSYNNGNLVFTRASSDVNNATVDTYEFTVTVTNSIGTDTDVYSVKTKVKGPVISSFVCDGVLDSQPKIGGSALITLPTTSGTVSVDVNCDGTDYAGTAKTFTTTDTKVEFSYSNGSVMTLEPNKGTFSFTRPSIDIDDDKFNTYIFTMTVTSNNISVNETATVTTMAGAKSFNYETQYPIDTSAGSNETSQTAFPKVKLEFSAIYRVLNTNLNYYESVAKSLISQFNEFKQTIEDRLTGQDSKISNALPVGSIVAYSGDITKIPSGWVLCDGNNGTPNLKGRFLEGYGTHTVNTYVSAGLPNIKGTVKTFPRGDHTACTGAFAEVSRWNTNVKSGADDDWGTNATFDASKSSSIYGASTTVQPSSYVVYYIMKVS